MTHYKENILALNYCLYSNLTQSIVFQDNCVIALNPHNANHQQSNLCFRIRLDKKEDIHDILKQTKPLFYESSLAPRYFIDELCGIPLKDVQEELAKSNIAAEIDTDFVMSWNNSGIDPTAVENKKEGVEIFTLRPAHRERLVQLFASAYGYGDDVEWLDKKLGDQLFKKDVYTIVGAMSDSTGELVSAVILNKPPGLKEIGHVNAVATHPKHQGKGLAGGVLRHALCGEKRTYYLEVYDDLYHAHRLYEKVGFKKEGILKSITVVL